MKSWVNTCTLHMSSYMLRISDIRFNTHIWWVILIPFWLRIFSKILTLSFALCCVELDTIHDLSRVLAPCPQKQLTLLPPSRYPDTIPFCNHPFLGLRTIRLWMNYFSQIYSWYQYLDFWRSPDIRIPRYPDIIPFYKPPIFWGSAGHKSEWINDLFMIFWLLKEPS